MLNRGTITYFFHKKDQILSYLLIALALVLAYQGCGEFSSRNNGSDFDSRFGGREGQVLLLRGQEVFKKSCIGCHSDRDQLASRVSVSQLSPLDIISRAIQTIPEMQPLSETLSQEEIEAVAYSLTQLRISEAIASICQNNGDNLAGRTSLQRLNNRELQSTILQLTGVDFDFSSVLPADARSFGFDNNAMSLQINSILVENLLPSFENIIETAFSQGSMKNECGSPTNVSCYRELIDEFAFFAYSRPVTPNELNAFMSQFNQLGRDLGGDGTESLKTVLTTVLLSPQFLFKNSAVGDILNQNQNIDQFELAKKLSYFIWSAPPDEELLRLASKGELANTATLEIQVERMLGDEKAKSLIDGFAEGWLELSEFDELAELAPADRHPLLQSMKNETQLFIENILFAGHPLQDLVTAKYTYANDSLATHYGLETTGSNDFSKRSLAGTERVGILGQGSVLFLTGHGASAVGTIIHRGAWVLSNLSCTPPPPPPAGITNEVSSQDSRDKSPPEILAIHRTNRTCATCHAEMDPLGQTLEGFDQFAQKREFYMLASGRQARISTQARLPSGEGLQGPDGLANYLVGTGKFNDCISEKALIYSLGRTIAPEDTCSLRQVQREFKISDGTLEDLVKAIVKTPAFLGLED